VPSLAGALRQARPARHELDTGGAHRFLTSEAALLVGAGFGVQLPAGWDGTRAVGLSLSARTTPTDRVLTHANHGTPVDPRRSLIGVPRRKFTTCLGDPASR
jgi:hypothetical protein